MDELLFSVACIETVVIMLSEVSQQQQKKVLHDFPPMSNL